MLTASPYRLTQDLLTFETHLIRSGLLPDSVEQKEKDKLRAALFAKGQPCIRASSLTKLHGWGAHFDGAGKIAIYGIDSVEYKKLSRKKGLTQLKAMRTSRK